MLTKNEKMGKAQMEALGIDVDHTRLTAVQKRDLRDKFAGLAMQGDYSDPDIDLEYVHNGETVRVIISRNAYKMADAMMEARK